MKNDDLASRSINTIRFLSAEAVQKAKSGHPGTPMALAPLSYLLWTRYLRYNPANPEWPGRDRFILSCGHASMLLYSMLHLTGYELSLDDLKAFRQWGSRTPGHPEANHTPGVEVTTGPLGQGLGNAVGMAIASRFLAQRFNRPGHEIVSHRIAAMCSDGDMMEGVASEAASLAGRQRLSNLTALLRRQQDHDRGIDRPRLQRGRGGALPGVRLERPPRRGREHRPRRDVGGDRGGVLREGAAHPGDRPDDHRLRQPREAEYRRRARGPARGGGDREDEGEPGLAAVPPVPGAGGRPGPLPRGGRPGGAAGEGMAPTSSPPTPRRSRSSRWNGSAAMRGDLPEGWADEIPKFPRGRRRGHPELLQDGAERDRAEGAGARRRIGGPGAVQRVGHKGRRGVPPRGARREDGTSTSACGSTGWARS